MTESGTTLQLSRKTLDEFARMATALEEFDAGGMDSILSDIFAADTADDYNKIFEGERGLPLDRIIKVTKVRYAPSDFTEGLPFYLVVDGVDVNAETAGQWTVGATVVVGTLVRAAFAGHLPCIGFAYEAEKQTKAGMTPVNWKMMSIKQGQAELTESAAKGN